MKYFRAKLAFLLTPLREGRRPIRAITACPEYFYSRPCGRGDRGLLAFLSAPSISTHAPAGGATIAAKGKENEHGTISTHAPAGGATILFADLELAGRISTHAPAGGATDWNLLKKLQIYISTHAPAGGATG